MRRLNPDIEDVVKKAADEYPLKTNTADWESVSKKLRVLETGETVIKRNFIFNRHKAGLVFVLLLIPISLAITKYYDGNYKPVNAVTAVKQDKPFTASYRRQSARNNRKEEFKSEIKDYQSFAINNTNIAEEQESNVLQETVENKTIKEANVNTMQPDIAGINKIKKDIEVKEKRLLIENSAVKEKSVSIPVIQQTQNEKEKRFYIGLVGAPELTNIKFQPSRKSVNAGVLMGYKINNKLNIELGAVLARKYFYTNGKYIAPNSIRKDNSEILYANGNSSITELPLTVQYNLKNTNNSRVFVSAGSVSYVIHKEHYRYTYVKNGEERQGSKDRKKASDNLFSNVQLSMGYEHSFNKTGNVRIEPYCRIPMRGIGISNLPVTSFGINIAVTKYIK